MITRGNLLWGVGGAIVGAVATYFVMEYVYEKELAEVYAEFEDERGADKEEINELHEHQIKAVVDITDAEMYVPKVDLVTPSIVTSDDEGEMEEAEEAVMAELHEREVAEEVRLEVEVSEDAPEKNEEDNSDAYDGIKIIEVSEVQPGRRIVAVFNHDNCTLEVAREMSVKNHHLEEVIDEDQFEDLLGLEAFNILMNTEPGKRDNMLAVRNNIINLDFAIRYSSK